MQESYLGESAAIATTICWTVTALAFEAASRRIGSLVVNFHRLVIAVPLLGLYGWVSRGSFWPADASGHTWLWLALSGVLGFAVGDLCLFRAFVVIGARLSMLLMALVPLVTTLVGWLILGETLSALQWLGMGLAVGGVTWVVRERAPNGARCGQRPPVSGIALGLGGAVGQAIGLVFSKYGMEDYDAFAATQIRVLAGIASFALIFSLSGWWPRTLAGLRHYRAMGMVGLGAVFGPFLGVSLSLLAVQHTETGVAATLMSLVPVVILIPTWFAHIEPITLRSINGAVLAVLGSALLFLS
jgi:drug/metabolite transporter (DMT)-like permease